MSTQHPEDGDLGRPSWFPLAAATLTFLGDASLLALILLDEKKRWWDFTLILLFAISTTYDVVMLWTNQLDKVARPLRRPSKKRNHQMLLAVWLALGILNVRDFLHSTPSEGPYRVAAILADVAFAALNALFLIDWPRWKRQKSPKLANVNV